MNAYLIHSPNSTFGQTEAGCHLATGQEAIVASAGLDSSEDEIAEFIATAGMCLCFALGNQREGGDQWGEMFPAVEMPVPPTREGLAAALKVGAKRRPQDPYIRCAQWAQYRLHFGAVPPILEEGSVMLDPTNLAYQREMLAGRA